MDLFGILTLIGGLAMFLYGMSVMGNGLEKISGGKLEHILERLTSNPIKAVGLGALVTAVIQSSSATTVMVVGFVNSGIMKLSQAIGIIMGANVGTTATSWLLSLTGIESENIWMRLLKPSSFSPILALIGVILYMSGKNSKKKDIGEIFLGFAVLMFGMESMSGAVKPLADVPEFTNILTMFDNPVLGVLVGAILTAVIQSSSASVGILQALAVTGAFTYQGVIPIIMGQNIGTCVTALLSGVGASRNAKRTAVVHLYFNIIGTIAFLVLYYGLNAVVHFSFTTETANAAGIALVHSIFNLFAVVLLLPFTKGLEKLAYLTLPVTDEEKGERQEQTELLDDRFLTKPTFAMEQAYHAIQQMAVLARQNFIDASQLLWDYTKEQADRILEKEEQVAYYDDQISTYLAKLNRAGLPARESQSLVICTRITNDFARISGRAVNLVKIAGQIHEKGASFSPKANEELKVYQAAMEDILTRAIDAFCNQDMELAQTVEPLEEVIDRLNKTVRKHHMKRLKKGKCTVELGIQLADVATNFERTADHCSNIALYLLQQAEDNLVGRHNYATMVKEDSDVFSPLYAEFLKKYTLKNKQLEKLE